MLFLSGNVHINPGPAPLSDNLSVLSTPHDFSCRNGLGILHFNVRSLVPKRDLLSNWFNTAKPDIVALSETWLKESTADNIQADVVGLLFIFLTSSKGISYSLCPFHGSLNS